MKLKTIRNGQEVASLDLKRLRGGDIELANIYVAPEWRGKGLASGLMEKAKASLAPDQNLVALPAPGSKSTGLTTEQIREWNTRHGFKPVAWYDLGGYSKRGFMIYTAPPTPNHY